MPKQVNLHRLRGSIAWILCLRWRWIHAYFASCLVSNRDRLGHCNWSPAAADWHSIQLYFHHLAPISTQTRSIPSNSNNQTGKKWYWVADGDNCATIASKHDITQQQFYEWSPATGSTCTTLWSKAYVCVGVSGQHILPNPQTPKGQPDVLTNLNPHRLLLFRLHNLRFQNHNGTINHIWRRPRPNRKRHCHRLRNIL